MRLHRVISTIAAAVILFIAVSRCAAQSTWNNDTAIGEDCKKLTALKSKIDITSLRFIGVYDSAIVRSLPEIEGEFLSITTRYTPYVVYNPAPSYVGTDPAGMAATLGNRIEHISLSINNAEHVLYNRIQDLRLDAEHRNANKHFIPAHLLILETATYNRIPRKDSTIPSIPVAQYMIDATLEKNAFVRTDDITRTHTPDLANASCLYDISYINTLDLEHRHTDALHNDFLECLDRESRIHTGELDMARQRLGSIASTLQRYPIFVHLGRSFQDSSVFVAVSHYWQVSDSALVTMAGATVGVWDSRKVLLAARARRDFDYDFGVSLLAGVFLPATASVYPGVGIDITYKRFGVTLLVPIRQGEQGLTAGFELGMCLGLH